MARRSGRQERAEEIAALLAHHGSLRLRDAARLLNVTEMTLRRDGAAPDAPFRCLGGHVVLPSVVGGYDLSRERDSHVAAKRAAARAAVALVLPDERIFLDCGTTTTHLAGILPTDCGLTVITHSLPVAEVLASRKGIGLEVIGGRHYPETASLHGDPPLPPHLILTTAFLSAGGVAQCGTVSCSHMHEVALKQAVLAITQRAFILIDRSKLGQRKPADFARMEAVEAIITEAGVGDRP